MRIALLVLALAGCSSSSTDPASTSDPCKSIDVPPGCEACWDTPAGACEWDGGAPAPASICCAPLSDAGPAHCASTAGKTLANVCR